MNCPTCHELVGADQWSASPWRDVTEPTFGVIVDRVRDLWIACEHCGPHHALQSAERRVLAVFRPRGSRARRRMYERIPGVVPIDIHAAAT